MNVFCECVSEEQPYMMLKYSSSCSCSYIFCSFGSVYLLLYENEREWEWKQEWIHKKRRRRENKVLNEILMRCWWLMCNDDVDDDGLQLIL